MKKYWMVWVTAVTVLVLGGSVYYVLYRHNTMRHCAIESKKKADKDNPVYETGYGSKANKDEYDTLYSFCMRTN